MQTTGDFIGILVELTTGMQLGHDDFRSRNAFTGMNIRRNAAAVVGDRNRSLGIERDRDDIGVTRKGFVNGIVHDFVDHMMQA